MADLKRASLPVTGIYIPPESSGCVCVVATKKLYSNIAGQIAACVWANKNGKYIPRVIVVEHDIDPTDLEQVLFAWATKCHPRNGTMVLENMPGTTRIYSEVTLFLNASIPPMKNRFPEELLMSFP